MDFERVLLRETDPPFMIREGDRVAVAVSGGEKYNIELRADVFNLRNMVVINGRIGGAQFASPTSATTLINNQYSADGTVNAARLTPRNAGFGAANSAQSLRTLQLQLRLRF